MANVKSYWENQNTPTIAIIQSLYNHVPYLAPISATSNLIFPMAIASFMHCTRIARQIWCHSAITCNCYWFLDCVFLHWWDSYGICGESLTGQSAGGCVRWVAWSHDEVSHTIHQFYGSYIHVENRQDLCFIHLWIHPSLDIRQIQMEGSGKRSYLVLM